jgi:hypothetical protein
MLEYEVMRMGCGPAYNRQDAIHMAVVNLMRDALKREVDPAADIVDWNLFITHVRAQVLTHERPDGLQHTVILTMEFESEAEAVYFKLHYGEHMTLKVLPDKHLNKNGVVARRHRKRNTVAALDD